MKESFSLVLAALTRNHTNWYWYGIKIAAFTFVKIKLLQHTSWCWYSTKNTGIVQNWQVRVVHFYIGTSVQIWCCYIILLNQLFCLTDFFTKQGNSCLLMLEQYKVDFVSVPNYTVTVQNMSFSFGVLCHMNCQRMNKKHNIKLHVKKLGCGECTVSITHMYT